MGYLSTITPEFWSQGEMAESRLVPADSAAALDARLSQSSRQLRQLSSLMTLEMRDTKTIELYKKIQAAVIKYRQNDLKAHRYVFSAQLFAETIIDGFEGVKSGEYTMEEVLDLLKFEVENKHFLARLEEVEQGLGKVVDELGACITDSGVIAADYQQSSQWFETMGDVAAEVSKQRESISAFGGMLGASSNALGAFQVVFSVFSRTTTLWAATGQRRGQEGVRQQENIGRALEAVSGIVGDQKKLIAKLCELVPNTNGMQHAQQSAFAVNMIIRDAKHLQKLCKDFSGWSGNKLCRERILERSRWPRNQTGLTYYRSHVAVEQS